MRIFFIFLLPSLLAISPKTERLQFEFNQDQNWQVILDNVMGGRSQGEVSYQQGIMRFSGKLSLENNGGFASIRSPYGSHDFANFSQAIIRYRGTGGEFAIVLEDAEPFYEPKYRYTLKLNEDWQEVRIPLADFRAYRLGRPLGYAFRPKNKSILRIGLIKADKNTRPFTIEVDYLRFR